MGGSKDNGYFYTYCPRNILTTSLASEREVLDKHNLMEPYMIWS